MNARGNLGLQAAPLISLCLIAGLWLEGRLFREVVADPGSYHAKVRVIAGQLPYRVGEWVGTDEKPPESAVSMLRPNVLLARRYEHTVTKERATLLLVQCRDTRDMGGHYPPHCYPAQGWTLHEEDTERKAFEIASSKVPVTIYRFTMESRLRFADIVIYNFFVRPDGTIASGRSEIGKAASHRLKVLGAGQVQMMFDASMRRERRDEVFLQLMVEAFPIVETIRDGAAQ